MTNTPIFEKNVHFDDRFFQKYNAIFIEKGQILIFAATMKKRKTAYNNNKEFISVNSTIEYQQYRFVLRLDHNRFEKYKFYVITAERSEA